MFSSRDPPVIGYMWHNKFHAIPATHKPYMHEHAGYAGEEDALIEEFRKTPACAIAALIRYLTEKWLETHTESDEAICRRQKIDPERMAKRQRKDMLYVMAYDTFQAFIQEVYKWVKCKVQDQLPLPLLWRNGVHGK